MPSQHAGSLGPSGRVVKLLPSGRITQFIRCLAVLTSTVTYPAVGSCSTAHADGPVDAALGGLSTVLGDGVVGQPVDALAPESSPSTRPNYDMRCASWVRVFTLSFRNALRRWYSTVLGLMNS